jgi:hypothetical protein
VTRTLNDVSRDLKVLARGTSAGEAALCDLAAALSHTNHSDLVGVDLAGTYAPAVMLPEGTQRSRWLASGLELIRDVLIFVPVIYTWWKLSQALRAYTHYKPQVPFLLAWQQGFGHQTQTLSASALVVASVVLGVVLLTLIAHLTRTWYDQQVEQRQQRLAALLAEASLLLTHSLLAGAPDVSKADLAAIGTRITTSAQTLQEALSKTGTDIIAAVNTSPGSKLHEMFERWTAAAHELRDLGTRLQSTQEVAEQLRETQTALSGMIQQVGDKTRSLLAGLETERSLSRQEAHAHHELAAQVGESTRLLGESLEGLSERAEEFNEMVHRLTYIVNRLDPPNGSQPGGPGGDYT